MILIQNYSFKNQPYFEQRILELFSFNKINNFLSELMNLGFNYAFKYPETINLELTSGKFYLKYLYKSNTKLNKHTLFLDSNYFKKSLYLNTIFYLYKNLTTILFMKLNPISTSLHYIITTKARSNPLQLEQLIDLRGYISNIRNYNSKFPILSNFLNGIKIVEYIISAYGVRKGILDTAIKTSQTGYLTRRLVETIQDIIIKERKCYTEQLIYIPYTLNSRGSILYPSISFKYKHIVQTSDILLRQNKQYFYSPFICLSGRSFCTYCVGYIYNSTSIPNLGLGVLAGESIGEPGTQLTLRTFHYGGINHTNIRQTRYLEKYNNFLYYKLLGLYLGYKFTYLNSKKTNIIYCYKLTLNYNFYNKDLIKKSGSFSYPYNINNNIYKFYIKNYFKFNIYKDIEIDSYINIIQILQKTIQTNWIIKNLTYMTNISYNKLFLSTDNIINIEIKNIYIKIYHIYNKSILLK